MSKTVHVFPSGNGWAVKREGRKSSNIFATQKEAIKLARTIARNSAPNQMIVHGRDGRLRNHVTYGLPRVQDPPRKSRNAIRIEKAVGRLALERVLSSDRSSRV